MEPPPPEPRARRLSDLVVGHQTSIVAFRRNVGTGLWAVLDGLDRMAAARIMECPDDQRVSLFRGPGDEDLSAIAPWLVRVDPGLFDWIVRVRWTQPWGIFATADPAAGLEEIRTHFRRLLLVDGPTGRRYYFRFYDPRVLERFWEMASKEQVAELFNGIKTYAYPDAATLGVRVVRPVNATLDTTIGRVRFSGRLGQVS